MSVPMEPPILSIIVPIYNVEEYLSKCIDSILRQTFTNFELILINDGSSDQSGKIIDEYAKQKYNYNTPNQSRLRLHNEPRDKHCKGKIYWNY